MASFTIVCGPSRASRRTSNTLGGYLPKVTKPKARKVWGAKRSIPSNNRFSSLAAINTSFKESNQAALAVPRPATQTPTIGSWKNRMSVNNAAVKELSVKRVAKKPVQKRLTRSCAYCHDEVHIHHIRDCHVLAEKNRAKAEKSRQRKAILREEKKRQAELRLAEQIRLAQENTKLTVEIPADSESDSDVEEDCGDFEKDFPRLQAAIDSGMVTTRRGSLRVSFKDDNEDTLMKPPCETKVFDTEAPPSAISSDEDTQVYPDEEEYLKLKRSKNAWKPKSQTTVHEQQKNLDQVRDSWSLKKINKKRWADIADAWSSDEEDDEL